jgi:hypothetical protein
VAIISPVAEGAVSNTMTPLFDAPRTLQAASADSGRRDQRKLPNSARPCANTDSELPAPISTKSFWLTGLKNSGAPVV